MGGVNISETKCFHKIDHCNISTFEEYIKNKICPICKKKVVYVFLLCNKCKKYQLHCNVELCNKCEKISCIGCLTVNLKPGSGDPLYCTKCYSDEICVYCNPLIELNCECILCIKCIENNKIYKCKECSFTVCDEHNKFDDIDTGDEHNIFDNIDICNYCNK